MPPFKCLKKIVTFSLCIAFIALFAACDKIPFFQDNSEKENLDQGNVRVEWQNGDDVEVTQKTNSEKTSQESIPDNNHIDNDTTRDESPESISQAKQPSLEFAVQIGAFLQADNATRLISKLKKKGYDPSLVIVKTPAKRWNLVRIGTYTNKQGALKAARKFTKTENMETAVVRDKTIIKMQPRTAQQTAMGFSKQDAIMPETVAKFEPEHFAFQVGGLRTKANANKHRIVLKKQGYAPYIKKIVTTKSNEVWYSVRIGTFDSIDLAADAAAIFTEKEYIPAHAVSVNN